MTGNLWARRSIIWLATLLIVLGTAAVWLVVDPAFRWKRQVASVAAAAPKDEFERRIHAYLLAHPEVITQSLDQYEAWQRANADIEAIVKSRTDELFNDPASPTGGNPKGDVTLVEFFDYNCPYCRQVAPIMVKAEEDDPQLRIVYKEFPILGPNSTFAAKAALAANQQGKYVAFHRALYQVRGAVDPEKVKQVATALGMDMNRLNTDMKDPAIQATIDRNLALAQALRINGTPGFVTVNQILRGATDLDSLKGMIRTAREHPRELSGQASTPVK